MQHITNFWKSGNELNKIRQKYNKKVTLQVFEEIPIDGDDYDQERDTGELSLTFQINSEDKFIYLYKDSKILKIECFDRNEMTVGVFHKSIQLPGSLWAISIIDAYENINKSLTNFDDYKKGAKKDDDDDQDDDEDTFTVLTETELKKIIKMIQPIYKDISELIDKK